MTSYDALLLLSFGGPEGPEDVIQAARDAGCDQVLPNDVDKIVSRIDSGSSL